MGNDRPAPHPEVALTWQDWAILALAIGLPSLGTWLYFVVFAGDVLWQQVSYLGSKGLELVIPFCWVRYVQKRPIRFALPSRTGLGLGLGLGLLVVAIMLAAYYFYLKQSAYLSTTKPAVWKKLQEIRCDTPLTYLNMALFISLIHSGFEEYYWRWFIFGQLRRSLGVAGAMAVSSLGFALHHIIVLDVYLGPTQFSATLIFSLCVAAGGAVWAWIYHRTGSLYGAWLSHLVIDAGLMLIGLDLCWEYLQ